jgi:hypothetical protein
MKPTAEFTASTSTMKYRLEATHDSTEVALEHVDDVPSVYLSTDGGQSFTKLSWKLSWLGHLKQLHHALEWPLNERIDEVKVEPGYVILRCHQSSYTDIVKREFRYEIGRGIWRC